MIAIFTKTAYILRLSLFLLETDNNFKIFTIHNEDKALNCDFDIGISYCYPRLIKEPLLSKPKIFLNFHPAPLPEYPGGDPYSKAVFDQVTSWGVTCHHMTDKYDEGQIYKESRFDVGWPVQNRNEIGAIAHFEAFKLFKSVIKELSYEPKNKICSSRQSLQGKR